MNTGMFFGSWSVYDAVAIIVSIIVLINEAMVLNIADKAKNKDIGVPKGVISRVLVTSAVLVGLSALILLIYIAKTVMFFMKK